MEKIASSQFCRLLIITDTYVGLPGGSERHLLNFLSHVDERFDVTVIQMIPSGNPMLGDGPLPTNPRVILHSRPLQRLYSWTFVRLIAELYRVIRREKIDIVVSYHEKADALNFVLTRLPGIAVATVSSKRDLGFKLSPNLKRLMRLVTHRFDRVTAPSTSIRDLMVNEYGVRHEKAIVIPNGVDLDHYRPVDNATKLAHRQQLGLPESLRLIGIVGSLSAVKGHTELLSAFARLHNKTPSTWGLVIIGDGELSESLKAQALQLRIAQCVYFVGQQKNIPLWLSTLDVVVSASHSEGLSNALIEAAASGLPIVATRVGGNPEIVSHDINGLLVDSENVDSLYAALQRLHDEPDLIPRYGQQARRKAVNEFSINSMVTRLQDLYCQLRSQRG